VPTGRFKICINRPTQVGVTGKCVTHYNWRYILSCPVLVAAVPLSCNPEVLVVCAADPTKKTCIPCYAAITGALRVCGGCDVIISCSAARQEPKYAEVYYYSETGDCSGGVYTCDPEFFRGPQHMYSREDTIIRPQVGVTGKP
jgi:hypothetical protein